MGQQRPISAYRHRAGSFDSHSIAAGGTWRFVANKTGVYDYICTLHPNMKGTLKVA
jgi:plastocyanin